MKIKIIFLIIILLIVGYISISKTRIETGEKTTFIPKFEKDGELVFVDVSDTLSIIDIEIVQNQDEITQGLMYRKSMRENSGMLFIFPDNQQRFFWMKNTYISLDIIYVDNDYKIVSITENTVPFSEDKIPSFKKAKYVVEVNAGFCKKNRITVGNKIDYNY
ncbi:MAG: DUF192 domain-containing protein [Candidatus Cloacimonadota bacterium]|nr:DUF192 domain-containing protein [Candidatus Cloacimonadota bacterium]